MNDKFPVDHDLPLPPKGESGALLRGCPFGAMKVGDSFFIPAAPPWGTKPNNISSKLSYAKRMWRESHPGQDFTARTVTEKGVTGVRVWRVA